MRKRVLCLLALPHCTVNQTLTLDPEAVLQYCVEHPEVEECALLQPPPAPAADAQERAPADQPSAYFVRGGGNWDQEVARSYLFEAEDDAASCVIVLPSTLRAYNLLVGVLDDERNYFQVQLNAVVLQEGSFRFDPTVEGEEESTPNSPWISGHVAKNGRAMHAAPEAMLARAVTLEAMEGSQLRGSFVIQDMCGEVEEGKEATCLGTLIGIFSCIPEVHLP